LSRAHNILVVDDERNVRATLKSVLEDEGYGVRTVSSGEEAIKAAKRFHPDLILLDIWLPGIDGLEVLEKLADTDNNSVVVMISGHGSVESAVRATKLGAFDFIEKPLSLDRVLLVVANGLKQKVLQDENRRLRAEVSERWTMIGESDAIVALRKQINRAAPTNGRVLIFGENGTGKELVAHCIHALSQRSSKSFVEINCAAIPDELIESELFGHVEGAFTGAVSDKQGKLDLADGGTLFLDEIGDMSLRTQSKVLRALQEQTFQPVGSTDDHSVDVRIIAATNKDLQEEIKSGRFREDLYYRINVIPFHVPSLRERRDDVPLLAEHFMKGAAAEYGAGLKKLSESAVARLTAYRWPGNVRQLKNVCERLMVMVADETIHEADLEPAIDAFGLSDERDSSGDLELREARDLFERRFILTKLREHAGNVKQTAMALNIERSHLYRKMKSYGIEPGDGAGE
jgi:two-component system nitrogen regulation response regulator NtrX|tara:strand:+ start:183 stop:1559 length:1377 start_codon:yes stop_codon:yes gene_type:complete